MSNEEIDNIKIYADAECTQPISTIEWHNSVKITLADKTIKIIPNTAIGGESASAIVWAKNEGPFDYGITGISFFDTRVQVILSASWLYPKVPVQITLVFMVPQNPTKNDIIKAGKINIEGFYIYRSIG
jgi:hypothetical protein